MQGAIKCTAEGVSGKVEEEAEARGKGREVAGGRVECEEALEDGTEGLAREELHHQHALGAELGVSERHVEVAAKRGREEQVFADLRHFLGLAARVELVFDERFPLAQEGEELREGEMSEQFEVGEVGGEEGAGVLVEHFNGDRGVVGPKNSFVDLERVRKRFFCVRFWCNCGLRV